MVKWRKYRRKLNENNHQEIPWLMMLAAADYRKRQINNEMLDELEEWAVNIEEVREALIEWEHLSANKDNRAEYEARMKQLRDLLSNLQGYHRMGKEEGIQEGIKEGLEMVARRMLEEGIHPTKIATLTGLSEDDIRRLE